MPLSPHQLRSQLNQQTGKIAWPELARHFARGVVIRVSSGMDLVEVAVCMSLDDKGSIERWLLEGKIARASMEDAEDWNKRQPVFWAVVAAPWVLVQEIEEKEF